MSTSLPLAIEALHRALVLYESIGDHASLTEALRRFANAGRHSGVFLPALLGTWRTLWHHARPEAERPMAEADAAEDPRFDGFVRVLLTEYDRARM